MHIIDTKNTLQRAYLEKLHKCSGEILDLLVRLIMCICFNTSQAIINF